MLNAIPKTIINFTKPLRNEYLRFEVPKSEIIPTTNVGIITAGYK